MAIQGNSLWLWSGYAYCCKLPDSPNCISAYVMIKKFERVVLTEYLPGSGLRKGDVGVVVEIYQEGEGFEVEFIALTGETVAVETLGKDQVRQAVKNEILHVRNMEAA